MSALVVRVSYHGSQTAAEILRERLAQIAHGKSKVEMIEDTLGRSNLTRYPLAQASTTLPTLQRFDKFNWMDAMASAGTSQSGRKLIDSILSEEDQQLLESLETVRETIGPIYGEINEWRDKGSGWIEDAKRAVGIDTL